MRNTILLWFVSVLIATDMVCFSGIALQLLCIALVALCGCLACYIGYKKKSGVWLSKQQYNDLHDLVKNEIIKDII